MPFSRVRSSHIPIPALLLASIFWGMGFTWAKAAGESINAHLHLPPGSASGPVRLLAVRFALGTVIWFSVFPKARRGWTVHNLRRSIPLGILLALGAISQHLGLDHTSEAVSAFLTNLTVIFVPLIVAVFLRRWPPLRLCAAITMAVAGIYLMTGAAPTGFGKGELFGLACAMFYAIYILAVDWIGSSEEPFRLTGVQFIIVTIVCFAFSALLPHGTESLGKGWQIFFGNSAIVRNTLLLTLLPTVGAYGLMMRFQPRISPTQATLIYLAEPIVAAIWAWWTAGRMLTVLTIIGAGLILLANLLAGPSEKAQ